MFVLWESSWDLNIISHTCFPNRLGAQWCRFNDLIIPVLSDVVNKSLAARLYLVSLQFNLEHAIAEYF